MCSRGRGKPKQPPCYKCGRPATRFCDHRGMEARYLTDGQGRKVRKIWIPSIFTCDRPMCDACANHLPRDAFLVDHDIDYCDEHNTEIARARSAKAEQLYQEQLRRLGIEEEP